MDAHFHEYLGAIAGMQELYGEPVDDTHAELPGRSDFHAESPVAGDQPGFSSFDVSANKSPTAAEKGSRERVDRERADRERVSHAIA